jgi:hypothetical protein
VRRDQAEDLLRLLRSAYPRTNLPAETSELWLTRLGSLDATLGAKAVESRIDGVKFWPSLAELHEKVGIVREQAARNRREEERCQELQALEAAEFPPLEEILRRFPEVERWMPGGGRVSGLPEEGKGDCSDCGEERPTLHRLGKFRVCADCAQLRLRAKAKTHDGEAA